MREVSETGTVCSYSSFCDECRSWSTDFRKIYVKHQRTRHQKRVSKEKAKAKSPPIADDSASNVSVESHVSIPVVILPIDSQSVDIDNNFKNTKNLFIHIALIPEGDNPRVNPNILKCLLHSPVAKGYRLVVIASRAMVCKTPTYYLILNSLAFARGCVILRSHILFPLLLILLISHHI